MRKLNARRAVVDHLEPHQVFNLIGGTSTGGYISPIYITWPNTDDSPRIIAIMLGRFKMSLNDCENAYLELMRRVFAPVQLKQTFISRLGNNTQRPNNELDSNALDHAIKDFIGKVADENILLQDDDTAPCKV